MEQENLNNQESTQLGIGAVSSRTFFDDIDRHFECYNQSEDYRKATHTLEKGRKLFLEIEVDEPEMTTWLFKWLYNRDNEGNRLIPFGCRLETIHFDNPTNEDLKRKLIELAESL